MRGETISLQLDGPVPQPGPRGVEDLVLEGEAADTYVRRLQRATRAARINAYFPDGRRLVRHFGFLGPIGSHGLYRELHLSPISGLPTVREILRVKIDKDLCAEFLADAAERPAPPPESKLAWRIAYYGDLARAEVMPLNRMSIELRQRRAEEGAADFRVVFDRLDLATSQFVRYTILLTQRDRVWARRHVELEREIPAATQRFRTIISRFAADEAELAFVLLSEVEGIAVEDIWRCRVGPLLLPGARVGPELLALLAPSRWPVPPWILCFPQDRAGLAVPDHSSGDPLAPLFREAVSAPARALVDAKADQLGYRVAKARKFVCPRVLVDPLRRLCRERGAPSIVKGV